MAQKITPNLWFDGRREEAATSTSVFDDGGITTSPTTAKGLRGGRQGGDGRVGAERPDFIGINGGPQFKFDEAVSFMITCKDQAEVDYYWERLTDGGEESQCGWLRDRFGLSWQVVPEGIEELISDPDRRRQSGR